MVPYWLTGWVMATPLPFWNPVRVAGAVIAATAGIVLVSAFVRFVIEGLGTPAPVAPTQHLVVGGVYRYVRNPMYIAVIAAIAGQAMLLGRVELLVYGAMVGAAMWAFARWYEEPYLLARFGDEFETYRRAVPGWWPRVTPWRPDR